MQPEARISQAIRNLVKHRGGFAFKVWGNAQMLAGLPDVICCYRGLFVAFEVKTPVGELSNRQRYVLRRIERCGGIVAVPRSVEDAEKILDAIDWRPIPDYSDYEINPYTREVRLTRTRQLRNQFISHGYRAVSLKNSRGQKPVKIARILASIFLGPLEPGTVVRHLNDDRQDDDLSNLALGTPRDNVEDAIRNGRTLNFSHKDCNHPSTPRARLHCNRRRKDVN